jgi:hypothetical protein
MASGRRAASDLIDAILDNMRANVETLRYSTLAPSRYVVYLSPAEFARLEPILPRLEAEAARALSEELDRRNRPSVIKRRLPWWPQWQRLRTPPLENAGTRWQIEFLCDHDGELTREGDLVVYSELVLPQEPELGLGARTRRLTTARIQGQTTTKAQTQTQPTGPASSPRVYARLKYEDARGRYSFDITRDSISIGRGGTMYPVDVRIASSEDVSREHARIRRDPNTGAFFLIDLSSLGTTLNGRHVPRGVDEIDGAKKENGQESELPDAARIGLANTVFLDFEKVTV